MFTLKEDDKAILQAALDEWGVAAQLGTAAEECIELAIACLRIIFRPSDGENYVNLVDETADVIIILHQIEIIAKDLDREDFLPAVADRVSFKLDRLKKRVAMEDGKT